MEEPVCLARPESSCSRRSVAAQGGPISLGNECSLVQEQVADQAVGNGEEAQAPATVQLLLQPSPPTPRQVLGSKALGPDLLDIQASSGSLVPTEMRVIQASSSRSRFVSTGIKTFFQGSGLPTMPAEHLRTRELEPTGPGPP